MQITDGTRATLNEEGGELRNHLVALTGEKAFDPNLNIAAGIRWLFHKRERAKISFGREAILVDRSTGSKTAIALLDPAPGIEEFLLGVGAFQLGLGQVHRVAVASFLEQFGLQSFTWSDQRSLGALFPEQDKDWAPSGTPERDTRVIGTAVKGSSYYSISVSVRPGFSLAIPFRRVGP